MEGWNRLGENDLRVAGRTEMDGIAQSESYKRTSFCYLKERRRWRSGEGNGEKEDDRTRVVVGQTVKRRNGGSRPKESKPLGGLPTGPGRSNRPRTCKDSWLSEGRKSKRGRRMKRKRKLDWRKYAREKLDSWKRQEEKEGKGRGSPIGSREYPGTSFYITGFVGLDDARRRGFEWKTKRSFSIWQTFARSCAFADELSDRR